MVDNSLAAKKTPCVARLKLWMDRLFPLVENVHRVGLFTSTSTISLANQETRLLVGDVRVTISVETLVLKCPLVGELADSARDDLRQIAEDVLRVAASQLGFAAE